MVIFYLYTFTFFNKILCVVLRFFKYKVYIWDRKVDSNYPKLPWPQSSEFYKHTLESRKYLDNYFSSLDTRKKISF